MFARPSLRHSLLKAGASLNLFDAAGYLTRRQVRVLTYHSVVNVDEAVMQKYPFVYRNAVSATRFENQMAFLSRKFDVISASTFSDFLNGARLSNRSLLITFDDGLLNNATVAAPILKRYNLSAVFFLPTSFVDASSEGQRRIHWTDDLAARIESHPFLNEENWDPITSAVPVSWPQPSGSPPGYLRALIAHLKRLPPDVRDEELSAFRRALDHTYSPEQFPADPTGASILDTTTWEDATSLVKDGFGIGSHTVSHPVLSQVDEDRARTEIEESRESIQQHLDTTCNLFSYPYGGASDFSRVHESMVSEAGYSAAFTQIPGFADQRASRMRVNRLDVSSNHSLAPFRYLLSGLKHRLVDPVLGRG